MVKWKSENVDPKMGQFIGEPVIVYGQKISENVYNMVHLHVNSHDESITMEYKFISDLEEIDKEKNNFTRDIFGNMLQYKILIGTNGWVRSILYWYFNKPLELNFREFQFDVGDYVNIEAIKFKLSNGDIAKFAKIESIPIQQTIVNAKTDSKFEKTSVKNRSEGRCMARQACDYPGFIDIEIIPMTENRPKAFDKISIPICKCAKITSRNELDELKSILSCWKDEAGKNIQGLIKKVKTLMSKTEDDFRRS